MTRVFTKKRTRSDGTEKVQLRTRSKWGIGALILAIPGVGSLIASLFGNILGNAEDAGMGLLNTTMGSALCLPICSSVCVVMIMMVMSSMMD
jgi:hypothetical protein